MDIFYNLYLADNSWDSTVGIVTRLAIRVRFPMFSLLSDSKTGLVANPAPGRGAKLTTHLHLVSSFRMARLYLHSAIRLHGSVLN
jgi:hypothetical protein